MGSVKGDKEGYVVDIRIHNAFKILTYLLDYDRRGATRRNEARKHLRSVLKMAEVNLDEGNAPIMIVTPLTKPERA